MLNYTHVALPTKYTGHTQKNGAVLIVLIITAPFVCVCPVYVGYFFFQKG
jgi:hypothetical protein